MAFTPKWEFSHPRGMVFSAGRVDGGDLVLTIVHLSQHSGRELEVVFIDEDGHVVASQRFRSQPFGEVEQFNVSLPDGKYRVGTMLNLSPEPFFWRITGNEAVRPSSGGGAFDFSELIIGGEDQTYSVTATASTEGMPDDCPGDLNGDGGVSISDLLELLGYFGVDCTDPVPGCTDSNACDYDMDATDDNGSCTYPEAGYDCEGNCLADADMDGICDEFEVAGCTAPGAINYDPCATEDDGSCWYAPDGCTEGSTVTFGGHAYEVVAIGTQCWFAENLRTATYRNGDPLILEATDTEWMAADAGMAAAFGEGNSAVYSGNNDEVANFAAYGYLYNGYAVADERKICPAGWKVPESEDWSTLIDFAGGVSEAGLVLKSSFWDTPPFDGANSLGFNGAPGGLRDGLNGSFINEGFTAEFWSSTQSTPSQMEVKSLWSGYNFVHTYFMGLANGASVRCLRLEGDFTLGCTDPSAENYDPSATEDDGNCSYTVVISVGASNLTVECDANTDAAIDAWLASNGGATATGGCGGLDWSHDYTGVQGYCSGTGEADVTFTAMDNCGNAISTTATLAIVDSTSPDLVLTAQDGVAVCDGTEDTQLSAWLGNLGGASAVDVCDDVIVWSYDFIEPSGAVMEYVTTFTAADACGNATSTTATFTIDCPASIPGCTDPAAENYDPSATEDDGSCAFGAPCTPVLFDGHIYEAVQIGPQCWFAENLRSDNYRNGDAIPGNLTDAQWASLNSGAQASLGDDLTSLEYGRLYNWFSVNDDRGLCPADWHVPSTSEWTTLTDFLGGTEVAGLAMKASSSDVPPWNGTNSSGFSGLPAGYRDGNGFFSFGGAMALWWTSTSVGNFAYGRKLFALDSQVTLVSNFHQLGYSIRCVRDSDYVAVPLDGCTDSEACNFNPLATSDDGSCIWPEVGFNCDGECLNDFDGDGLCDDLFNAGCTDPNALNYDPAAWEEDGSCIYPSGCTDPAAENYDPMAVEDDGSCVFAWTCTPVTFDGYTYEVVQIGDKCWFAENLRSDNYRNGDAIPGNLTDADWAATVSGAQAIDNNADDYLAIYGRVYNRHAVNDIRFLCPTGWHVPTDGDWTILTDFFGGLSTAGNALKSSPQDEPGWDGSNTSGFSALPGGMRLGGGYFGAAGWSGAFWSSSVEGLNGQWHRLLSPGDEPISRWSTPGNEGFSIRCISDWDVIEDAPGGCTDPAAENYDPNAVEDDGSCTFALPCAPVTFDGYSYEVVEIGDQCWFAENLRSDNYRNGDAIPGNLSNTQWSGTTQGAHAIYNNDAGNLANYGRLYNWYAVDDARGLCPTGWHVPTDEEWMTLEISLGMTSSAANFTGWRGTDQGAQMKSSLSDSPSWNGSNASGFSALPGGIRYNSNGYFYDEGDNGNWWSSSPFGSNSAWSRFLASGHDDVNRGNFDSQRNGLSVRCVRDSDDIAAAVEGCTDPTAENYDATASEDDGSCTFASTCVPVTFDGYSYEVVQIGDQCWFAENLRSDNYRNGDAIPGNLTDAQWTGTASGAQAISNNVAGNLDTYGRLYNWYAVDDARGLCPTGWHVPTDGEWTALTNFLGGDVISGEAMKSSPSDIPSWDGSNSSGFSALGGGARLASDGGSANVGALGYWWSSTSYGSGFAWSRILSYGSDGVTRSYYFLSEGRSVRCLLD